MTGAVIDLFAGPGGWDLGARALGIDPLGIEWDDAACKTRHAAGLRTLQADVAALDPHATLEVAARAPQLWGLIASPPCQAFSMAGKGQGRRDIDAITAVAADLAQGRDTRRAAGDALAAAPPEGALFGFDIGDARALHVVEPLRWALALRPRWIACEQVAPVLPLWQLFAGHLAAAGYSTWAGVLSAEQYGVPQTRKRAVLLASLDQDTAPPAPTHTAYAKGKPRQANGLLPWVSMADALGWGMTARPYPVIATSRHTGGPDKEKVGGSAARETIYAERDAGRWQFQPKNARPNVTLRDTDEPAPALAFGHNAPTWVHARPATTVAGDSRIWPPGHKINADDIAAGRTGYGDRAGTNAIRVTEAEAAVLQTFPHDYPWQGTKTDQFVQIGNAVPPLLAQHVLAAITGAELDQQAAA